MLNKHKVTKTLSNSPWREDTKVLAVESLCLQFSGVALRAFVSLCLIVLWLFVEVTLFEVKGQKTTILFCIVLAFSYLCTPNNDTENGMKLILLTCPEFFVEEDKILTTLFEEGLDILHLRKPNSEPVFCERLLSLMPEEYRSKIVVHDHFYLRDEFGLLGIHLSKRHPQAPASYKGPITRTCYDLQSVVEQKPLSEYVLLRNIFDSISESENKASFTPDELRTAARAGIIDRNVIAEGGVSLDNIEQVREWGFGGVAIRGDLWNHFDVHSQRDYKDLIAHFRKLRKAVG